jgi:RHS repeat-associated protein
MTTLSSNTTWTLAGSPYILDGNVTVAAGVTLTIDPGVVVKLNGTSRQLRVSGTLKALGSASAPITFTSYQDDTAGGDSNGDGAATSGAPGQWYSIYVASGGSGTELKFVNVRYGGWGFGSGDGTLEVTNGATSVTVEDSTFSNNQHSAIVVGSGVSAFPGVTVRRSTLANNGNGMSVSNAWVDVSATLIRDSGDDGIAFNLGSGYTGPASSIMDSEIRSSADKGIWITSAPDLSGSFWPHGNRNNIYGNITKQFYTDYTRRTVDWSNNYWGDGVYHWYNPSACPSAGENSLGKLASRSSQANPPDGPITGSLYFAGTPSVTCYFDRINVGPIAYSPFPFRGPVGMAIGQALGSCGSSGEFAVDASECMSDPVNSATGSFTHSVTDLDLPGIGVGFAFTRTYNSLDPTAGPLGPGWTHSYNAALAIKGNGDVSARAGSGQQLEFIRNADGTYTAAAGGRATLVTVSGGYELTTNDQLHYRFDTGGRLTSLLDRNGKGLTLAYDGNGRLSTITDAAARQITLSYDPTSGLLTGVAAPGGRSVSYAYTGGRLSSVTDVAGKVWTYTYEANGFLEKEIDPLQHTLVRNVYGPDGRVTEQYDALNNKTSFAWDQATQTQTATDARNNTWKDVYANNVLQKRIDASAKETTFVRDSALNESSVTGPDGKTTTMSYDARGNLTQAVAPASLGAQKTITYDALNNVTSVTDGRSKVTNYTYDANGNNTSIVHDGVTVATYTYNASGQVTSFKNGRDYTTSYTYDANGNLESETDPLGNKTTYTYDAAGRTLTRVGPRGNVQGADPNQYKTSYSYDAAGRTLTETDPLGNVSTYAYDNAGNRTSITDARNKTTGYTYDAANRLLTVTASDTGVTMYSYDAVGNKITEKNPNNQTTTYTYDANNRLASSTTPLGNKTTYTYDASGNLTKQVEPRGNVTGANPDDYATTSTYDAAGRLLTETDPLGNTTTYTYDAVGNKTSVKDANNHSTSYGYDGLNRLSSVTAPGGAVTAYTYDAAGNLLTRTDANNHATTYVYDAANRLTTMTLPLSRQWTYEYDAAGNRTKMIDANGNATQIAGDGTTTYGYDRADRLTGIDYSDSTPDVSYSYDVVGNRTQMTDGAGTQTYAYDAVSRLTNVTRGTDTFTYTYDLVGSLTRRTYPDGTIIDYTYDNDSRMAAVASGGQSTSYTYDAAGNITATTLPASNGYIEDRTYDRAGRLTRVKSIKSGSTLVDVTYTLDPVGNPTQVVRAGGLPGTTTYAYDARDRLTEVCFQAGCPGGADPFIRWTYDGVGNRLTEARPTGTTSYSYNAADQLLQAGSTVYTYDSNGNQTAAGSRTATFDLANRINSTSSGSTTTSYRYDGDGNRTESSTAGGTTSYVWDSTHQLPELALERAPGVTRRYTYGHELIAVNANSNDFYFHRDRLGSTVNLTSANGTPQWTYDYEPFGKTRWENKDDPGAPSNLSKFAGELEDAAAIYNLRAREYDAAQGRFLQLDPITPRTGLGANALYVYADDRPTYYVDPSGETFEPADASVVAANRAASPCSESETYRRFASVIVTPDDPRCGPLGTDIRRFGSLIVLKIQGDFSSKVYAVAGHLTVLARAEVGTSGRKRVTFSFYPSRWWGLRPGNKHVDKTLQWTASQLGNPPRHSLFQLYVVAEVGKERLKCIWRDSGGL